MATQTQTGKAFEYAVLKALYDRLSTGQLVSVTPNSSVNKAQQFYEDLDNLEREKMDAAAGAAGRHIVRLEPQLEYPDGNTPLLISLQCDAAGKHGDVRDVLTIRQQNSWEIGISCKHNHAAVKHSRLSKHINFGADWLGYECSQEYFSAVTPIFEYLERKKNQHTKWSDMPYKVTDIYMPVLNAFSYELQRLANAHSDTPKLLLQYLLGRNDFYKVIANDNRRITTIQAFNFEGTLNRAAGTQKSLTKVPRASFPGRVIDISYKEMSSNTIIVTCDHGWSLSMRIHNASSQVEPSLKFDVTLEGIPPELYKADEPWDT
jgi:hypothetical protein